MLNPDQCPHCLPVCKNRFETFARIFSRRHKQTTFSDAGFLGILRVKRLGLTLISVHTVCLYAKLGLKSLQEYSADDINRRHFTRSFTADRSKAVLLLQFFSVCASMGSYVTIDLVIICSSSLLLLVPITKTCLYNTDPLKPHSHIVKLGFTGVYIIFLTSAQKHRLWILVRTASLRRF